MLSLFFVAALQGAPTPARIDPRRDSPVAIQDSLEAAELAFFHEWREAYMLSESARHDRPKTTAPLAQRALARLREGYTMCFMKAHWGQPQWGELKLADPIRRDLFGACPTWLLTDSVAFDEQHQVDAALDERFRGPVRQARASLIAQFDLAARALPTNQWIAGQRVRLLVDQVELDRALAASRECKADGPWCRMLEGFADATAGRMAAADSVFELAMRGSSKADRCSWEDVYAVLDSAARAHYLRASCEARDSLNALVWWLADPLWSEPGNERRAVHFARQVAVRLKRDASRDERYSWRAGTSGDVMTEMIVRYGWPTYTYWSGILVDYFRSVSLTMAGRSPYPVYTTFEYSKGRLKTVPSQRLLSNPFMSAPSDWWLNDPDTLRRSPLSRGDNELDRATDALNARISAWWPREHIEPTAPIADLTSGQTILLRRQSGALLGAAVDLDSTVIRAARGGSVEATLLVSERPDSMRAVTGATISVGLPLTFLGEVAARPAVASIEVSTGKSAESARARMRFGMTPQPPLSALAAGEVALSDVGLLRPDVNDALPNETREALRHMMTSAKLEQGQRLGLYWETYGISPDDTVDIAVWIERYTPQGILRRFGTALSVAQDLNTPVSVAWRETAAAGRAHIIPGAVPVIGRSVILDSSRLPRGDYWLDVVVRRAAGEPVRTRRSFTVVGR